MLLLLLVVNVVVEGVGESGLVFFDGDDGSSGGDDRGVGVDGGSAGAAHRDDPGDGVSRSDGTCAGSAHREDFHVASRLGVAGVVVVAVFVVDDVDSCGD